jgi:tetratricopeptide (TPR) repeat protein
MKSLLAALLTAFAGFVSAQTPPPEYEKALNLIHAYSGAGNELDQAMRLTQQLMSSQPKSGYAQTLAAEMISTWRLNEGGEPTANLEAVLDLTEQALSMNPRLAQAYVARARALLKSGKEAQGSQAIDTALEIDPNLSGAHFIKADLYRRTGRVEEAEVWYRKFIEGISSPQRKSNAYSWMGEMYKAQASAQPREWAAYVAKARDAYQNSVDLDPQGAWKLVNFANFLNNQAADFDAAERYAERALKIMDFPMARFHLASARYQKVGARASSMNKTALRAAVADVEKSTGISLREAIDFCDGCPGIRSRLKTLSASLI